MLERVIKQGRESTYYAELMCAAANRIGLNLQFENPTPMDGNCFYHSVIDQIHRRSIMNLLDPNLCFTDHLLLRTSVVSFVRENQFNLPLIQHFRHVNALTDNQWEQMLLQQGANGTYASEIFCRCTAILLNIECSDSNHNIAMY